MTVHEAHDHRTCLQRRSLPRIDTRFDNQIEIQFLPDVTVPCEICQGRRYNREALEVTMRDQSIADVLSMTVAQALDFSYNFPKIRPKLETLRDVGLGYIRLGQPATTLSGGEAPCVELGVRLSPRTAAPG